MSSYTFFKIFTFGLYRVPFTDDPLSFKFRMEKLSDSKLENRAYAVYSGNGGLTWKYVMAAYLPLTPGNPWEMDRLIFDTADIAKVIDTFQSYAHILEFEELEQDKVRRGNKKLTKEQKRRRKQIKDTLNQVNSTNSEYRGTP